MGPYSYCSNGTADRISIDILGTPQFDNELHGHPRRSLLPDTVYCMKGLQNELSYVLVGSECKGLGVRLIISGKSRL